MLFSLQTKLTGAFDLSLGAVFAFGHTVLAATTMASIMMLRFRTAHIAFKAFGRFTEETLSQGLDGKPEAHVLEGNFK